MLREQVRAARAAARSRSACPPARAPRAAHSRSARRPLALRARATRTRRSVCLPFLAGAAAIFAGLAVIGRKGSSDLRIFSAGGFGLWWCLLRAGVSADVAGVLVTLCVSTRTVVDGASGPEELNERLIARLSPLATFVIMPAFSLANTAVPLRGALAASGRSSAARRPCCSR